MSRRDPIGEALAIAVGPALRAEPAVLWPRFAPRPAVEADVLAGFRESRERAAETGVGIICGDCKTPLFDGDISGGCAWCAPARVALFALEASHG